MALSREQVGLVFKINADTAEARKELHQFRSNLAGILETVTPLGNTAARAFGQIAASLLSTTTAAEGAAVGVAALNAAMLPIAVTVGAIAAAVGGLVLIGKGLFDLAVGAGDVGAQMKDLSDKTGVSVRNINLLRIAAQESGKDFKVVERSLDQFVTRMDDAARSSGKTEGAFAFRRIGIDAKEGMRDVNAALETGIKSLNNYSNEASRGADAQRAFGLRNQDIVPIITRVGASLDEYEKTLNGLGIITDQQATNSKIFKVALDQLKNAIEGVQLAIGSTLLVGLTKLIDLMKTVIQVTFRYKEELGLLAILLTGPIGVAVGGFIYGLAKLGSWLLSTVGGIDNLNAILRATPAFLNVVKVAFIEVAEILKRLVSSFGLAGAAIGLFLTGNFDDATKIAAVATETISSLFDGLGEKTAKAWAAARDAQAVALKDILANRAKVNREGGNSPLDLTTGKPTKEGHDFELDLLKQRLAALELLGREETRLAEDALDKKTTTAEAYEKIAIESERHIFAFKQQVFAAERAEIEKTITDKVERQAKLAAIDTAELREQLQLDAAIRAITKNRIDEEIRLDKERAAEDAASVEAFRVSEEARIKIIEEFIRKRAELAQAQAEAERKTRVSELTPQFGGQTAEMIARVEDGLNRETTAFERATIAAQEHIRTLRQDLANALEYALDFQNRFKDAMDAGIDTFISSGGSLKQAANSIVKSLLAPWITYCAIQAKIHAAEAIASAAYGDYRGAVLHGLAAAGFAVLGALGTAVGNAAFAGGGKTVGPSSGSPASRQQDQTRIIEQGDRPSRQPPQVIIIRAEVNPDVTVRVIDQHYRGNGAFRQTLRSDLLGEGIA